MKLRSLLFVPGDRPDRFAKAEASGADAVILDLEDSVAPSSKDRARAAVADYLSKDSTVQRLVRINPVDGPHWQSDLSCLSGADGVVLPKALGAATVEMLALHIPAHLPILPIASETPQAIFEMGSYGRMADRLCGLCWGAEDLPAAIGAVSSRQPDGNFTAPYEMVRSLALFAAHAAGVAAIETVYPAIDDHAGLARYAARGAYDGFTGMLALHPAQVPPINAAFTPSDAQVEAAHRIVEAFAAAPDAGVLKIDGRMVDAPHLAQARKILERAEECAERTH